MKQLKVYSSMFTTIHDGANATILRATVPVDYPDADDLPLIPMRTHDFAVVWDEDHDERVVIFAEQLLMAGVLGDLLILGERKGMVQIEARSDFFKRYEAWGSVYSYGDVAAIKCRSICHLACVGGDEWVTEIWAHGDALWKSEEGLEKISESAYGGPAPMLPESGLYNLLDAQFGVRSMGGHSGLISGVVGLIPTPLPA